MTPGRGRSRAKAALRAAAARRPGRPGRPTERAAAAAAGRAPALLGLAGGAAVAGLRARGRASPGTGGCRRRSAGWAPASCCRWCRPGPGAGLGGATPAGWRPGRFGLLEPIGPRLGPAAIGDGRRRRRPGAGGGAATASGWAAAAGYYDRALPHAAPGRRPGGAWSSTTSCSTRCPRAARPPGDTPW